jgi:transposase
VVVLPRQCGRCHRPLTPPAGGPTDFPQHHQVAEIPREPAFVTEYDLHALICTDCGASTRAELPPGVSAGCAGPRLQAALSILTGRYRLSRREAGEMIATLFGEKAAVADGTIVELEKRTSAALKPAYDEAIEAVRKAGVVNADETGWRIKSKKAWLWVAATALVAVFRIDRNRSKAAWQRFLGGFAGILCTDRYAAYASHPLDMRQLCWAHLKRDIQALVDAGGAALRVGRWGLRSVTRLFSARRDFKDRKIDRQELSLKGLRQRSDFGRWLAAAARSSDHRARSLAHQLNLVWPALFTFFDHEGVEPTNNYAERRVRPAVLWRKGSFGTQSEEGNRFVERMLTTVQSLRLQGRSVLDFVEETIRAHANGQAKPSLLPAVQSSGDQPLAATA